VGRPFLTGRIHYTPGAEQQLNDLDEWITEKASADTAERFVRAIIEHIDEILLFPLAGEAATTSGPE
jgi:toxin ParE1/3/4